MLDHTNENDYLYMTGELLPHQLSEIIVLQVNYDAKSLNPTDIIGFGLMANTVAWAAFLAAIFFFS